MKILKSLLRFLDDYGVLIGGILVAMGIFVSNIQTRQALPSKSPCPEARNAL